MSIGLTRLLQLECRLSVESEYRGSDSAREREGEKMMLEKYREKSDFERERE